MNYPVGLPEFARMGSDKTIALGSSAFKGTVESDATIKDTNISTFEVCQNVFSRQNQ